jgi:hypothetical protein
MFQDKIMEWMYDNIYPPLQKVVLVLFLPAAGIILGKMCHCDGLFFLLHDPPPLASSPPHHVQSPPTLENGLTSEWPHYDGMVMELIVKL